MNFDCKNTEKDEDNVVELDVKGYNCPIPLLRTKKALANMAFGELIRIVTTDPGAEIDFRVFAEASGNELVSIQETGGILTLIMCKRR